jgi:hypothetical protein
MPSRSWAKLLENESRHLQLIAFCSIYQGPETKRLNTLKKGQQPANKHLQTK